MWFSVIGISGHAWKMVSMTSAYPATSCSSRVAKDLISRLASRRSTSRSDSLLPSMRVEKPMLSMVATRRRALRRSGARVPSARHAPLNSSISAMSMSTSGVYRDVGSLKHAALTPIYTPISTHISTQENSGNVSVCEDCGFCLSAAASLAILSMKPLWGKLLLSDFLDCAVDPTRRRFGVGQYLSAPRFRQPCPNLRDDLGGDPLLAKRLERMNDQTALLQPNPGFLQGRMLESQSPIADLVTPVRSPVRSIRQI